jgi:hypothetical protein
MRVGFGWFVPCPDRYVKVVSRFCNPACIYAIRSFGRAPLSSMRAQLELDAVTILSRLKSGRGVNVLMSGLDYERPAAQFSDMLRMFEAQRLKAFPFHYGRGRGRYGTGAVTPDMRPSYEKAIFAARNHQRRQLVST